LEIEVYRACMVVNFLKIYFMESERHTHNLHPYSLKAY